MLLVKLVLFLLVVMGGCFPLGAQDSSNFVNRQQRLSGIIDQVRSERFAVYGKKLTPFVKGSVNAIPSASRPSLEDVIVINDIQSFIKLFGLPEAEEAEMKSFIEPKDAFAFIGSAQLFINGANPTYKVFEAAFAAGDTKPIRLLRAKLMHENRHAAGEAKELPCYQFELSLLDEDYRKGLLSGAETYISQVRGYYSYLQRTEAELVATK